MRDRRFIFCGLMTAILVMAAAFIVVAADKGPDNIVIKSSLWPTPTKAAVPFGHKMHQDELKIACTQCHHKYVDGKNVWKEGDPVAKCETCHTNAVIQGESQLPPDQKKLNLKIAFHTNCQNCHKKAKAEKPDSKAPVVCTGCHPAAEKK